MCITKLLYRFTGFKVTYITYGGARIRVLLADSPRRMMLGLMHRSGLGKAEGMLFVPGHNAMHGIWMHNMRFSIDILWLSRNGKVVDMLENAKPCTSIFNCPTYKPSRPSFYILELAAGSARRMGVKAGSRFDAENINKPFY